MCSRRRGGHGTGVLRRCSQRRAREQRSCSRRGILCWSPGLCAVVAAQPASCLLPRLRLMDLKGTGRKGALARRKYASDMQQQARAYGYVQSKFLLFGAFGSAALPSALLLPVGAWVYELFGVCASAP